MSLVVDVDGSPVGSDLLTEGTARLRSTTTLNFFALRLWLVVAIARGRAALKCKIAQAVSLPTETLALNPAVMKEITAAKAAGHQVWLALAANELVVAPLVEMVGAAGHLASDGRTNLAGQKKANALVKRFGKGGFIILAMSGAIWPYGNMRGMSSGSTFRRAWHAICERWTRMPDFSVDSISMRWITCGPCGRISGSGMYLCSRP